MEIENFVSKKYYEISGVFQHENGWYKGKLNPAKQFDTKDDVIDFMKKKVVNTPPEAKVLDVKAKEKTTPSPKLYSLSGIQTKMNRVMKASPKDTLAAAQSLYDKKLLSYPRSDSTFITNAEWDYLKENFNMYQNFLGARVENPDMSARKRYVDSTKVQEHHAIIPTKRVATQGQLAKLSPLENAVYMEIMRTTFAMFEQKYKFEETVIMTGVDKMKFKTVGNTPIDEGWKRIFPKPTKKTKEDPPLPIVQKDDPVKAKSTIDEKETKPPKPYTEGTLLNAMITAGKTTDDEEAQAILNEVEGIGTEATRAGIIDRLLRKDKNGYAYVQKKKNFLYVTPKGITLCKAIAKEHLLSSVQMTAEWEKSLRKIGKGENTEQAFLTNILKYINHLIADVPGQIEDVDYSEESAQLVTKPRKATKIGICPVCGKDVLKYQKVFTCSDKECKFHIFRIMSGKTLTDKQAKSLITDGTTGLIEGFKSKAGKVFNATLVLQPDGEVKMEFSNPEPPSNGPIQETAPTL
jgi:DNA topoisomerase-3